MDAPAYDRLKTDFLKAPTERWGAVVSSVGVAVAYLALLVLLYLFVDLLVWQGRIPGYSQLTPARQREFAEEWAGRPEEQRTEAVRRVMNHDAAAKNSFAEQQVKVLVGGEKVRPPTAGEWEARWQAGVYLALRDRVGQAAADVYLPEKIADRPEQPPRLGALSLVVRERNHRKTGYLLGAVAAWNGWMWQPGADGNANLVYLTGLFAIGFTLAAVRGLLLNTLAYLAAVVTLDVVTRVRRAVYLHTFRLGAPAGRSGEAVQLFTKQTDAVGAAVHASLTSGYRYPILVCGLLVLILLINLWLAISFLLLALLVWVIAGQMAAYFRREGRAGSRQAAAALAMLVESLGLVRLVKCFQMERFNQNRVERQLAEESRADWRRMRGDALAGPLLRSVALMAAVALFYLAARSVLAGEFTVAGLATVAVATVSLGPAVAGWVDARLRLRRGREAADAVMEYLGRHGDAAEASDAEYLPGLTTRMEFRGVTVQEPGASRPVLENVSFAVPAGTRVAVVGPSAAEKRALVSLIPRFIDPTAGEIRIEDKNIRWVTHESLRAQVAVVLQDDWMFTDTAANNIGCGDPQYNLPRVIEAAKLAHAHQFIERLPYGYETVVGDHGHALLPGERFRLALARALLRDPSILIIEEPSGPIDEDTVALLDDTLERASAGRTIIFLANRLSTLRNVDRVFLLRDGHLEASGSHRDLWENNEYYRRLQIVADSTGETSALPE